MATKNNSKDPEKTVDVPPYGSRNPDPITDAPGSHPIETGVGAAVGGAAAGAAAGALGGPVGAIIGAIIGGGVAGGLAGKGVGELIDPTTEDTWLRDYYASEKNRPAGRTHEDYRPAYRYGMHLGAKHSGRYEDIEPDVRSGWDRVRGESTMSWDEARGAVRHAYDRAAKHCVGAACGTANCRS